MTLYFFKKPILLKSQAHTSTAYGKENVFTHATVIVVEVLVL